MKIYADILFFINFVSDFFIIKLASEFMGVKVRFYRVILASLIGGIFGVLAFLPDMRFLKSTFCSLVLGFIMGAVSFLPCPKKEYFKFVGIMYVFSIIFAGTTAFFMLNFGGGVLKNGVFYTEDLTLFFAFSGVWALFSLAKNYFKRRMSTKISSVEIFFRGKKASVQGFFDTGNGLYDPITKKPVMLIDKSLLKTLIDEKCTPNNLTEWVDRGIKIIPYRAVGEEGFLTGFLVDFVKIDNKKIPNVIVAVSENALKYPVILHAGL